MMMELQWYDITILYVKGSQMYIADTLSRAHLPITQMDYDADERICQFFTQQEFEGKPADQSQIDISDEHLRQIAEATVKDPVLQQLMQTILQGWISNHKKLSPGIVCFYHICDELTVDYELIF